MEGEVVEALRNRMFRIALDNGHETLGYTAGKMRRYRIRIFLGDRVRVELSPYDLSGVRIFSRYRKASRRTARGPGAVRRFLSRGTRPSARCGAPAVEVAASAPGGRWNTAPPTAAATAT